MLKSELGFSEDSSNYNFVFIRSVCRGGLLLFTTRLSIHLATVQVIGFEIQADRREGLKRIGAFHQT